MYFTLTLAAASLATLAVAGPTQTLNERSTETCEQYGSITTGSYIIYNDLWGESDATSGSQCTTVESLSGETVVWETSWTWTGGSSVKSYANAALTFSPTKLSTISSIESTWEWSYSGDDIVGDVSYDTFLASSATADNDYEVMIWLEALGDASPISSTYTSSGAPDPVASDISIADYTWNLYKGTNGDTTVFSFVYSDGALEKFSGNLMEFYTYLIDYEDVSSSQYLTVLEAGTEPTTGSDAVLTVSAYSVAIST